jgi:Rhodopirellula transposase DDE domain
VSSSASILARRQTQPVLTARVYTIVWDVKWNPIEHRLFGPISINWAAKPLRTFDTLLAAIRGTTTRTGLTVQACRLDGSYPTGLRVTKAEMDRLNITPHDPCPKWTYTIRPRDSALDAGPNRELSHRQ